MADMVGEEYYKKSDKTPILPEEHQTAMVTTAPPPPMVSYSVLPWDFELPLLQLA